MSNRENAHYHEKQDDQKKNRQGHAAATAADALLGAFRETFVTFSATGKQQSYNTAHQGANKDKSQHSEQIY